MEFTVYNNLEHTNSIKEIILNKVLDINLCYYKIIFYKHPNYYFACYCYKGNYVQ